MKRHILSKKTFQRISTLSVIAGATIMGPLSFGAEVAGIPYAPAAMNDVQLGMQVDEIKRIFSNTKEIGDAKRNLLFAYFENALIWEAAMFDFKAGRLTAVSLLKGVTTTANVPELLRNVSRELVRVLGREFKRKVAAEADGSLLPMLVWSASDRSVYLQFNVRELSKTSRPYIRLTYAGPNKPVDELFQPPSRDQLEEAAFEALSGAQIVKDLGH